MKNENLILRTDSYKLNHWNQYPQDSEGIYSYFEARNGAEYPYTVFFGLQALIEKYLTLGVTQPMVDRAQELTDAHMGPGMFNRAGWEHIVSEHGGRLPLRIKAVPEGTRVPNSNVLMTVENTDPACFWLPNALESLLVKAWYASTVATLSTATIEMVGQYLDATGGDRAGLGFMLHDFGYRGASSEETAESGGAAHLISSRGTDTLVGMQFARDYYDADLATLGFSVPATEHSVMTARGRDGEFEVLDQLLANYPTGILSVVADSYDIYKFVDVLRSTKQTEILHRDGTFVVRPDSITAAHGSPQALVVEILWRLWNGFDGMQQKNQGKNEKGFMVLPPQVRVLWGDGIDPAGIEKILQACKQQGFAAKNLVFGMGGGLLQKVNRDTQRFAFKASGIKRAGEWSDIQKSPLDQTKASKPGRLKLIGGEGAGYATVAEDANPDRKDELVTVFENGEQLNRTTFDEVRERCGTL